uniref:Uncharacterized protein n=1 Tax=Desulfobacca acetoxidans TaxID=60893 RepID=A0A7V4G8X1_9BACT
MIRVYVNGEPVFLLPGMKVRHALIAAGLMQQVEKGRRVVDRHGYEVGLDGAIFPEMHIFVR